MLISENIPPCPDEPQPYRRITELNLRTGTLIEPKQKNQMSDEEVDKMLDDKDIDGKEESDIDSIATSTTTKVVTSMQTGLLYHIDIDEPYITEMKSYDPMNDEWKSLPGPPEDRGIQGAYMHPIPQKLIADLRVYPQVVFEDYRSLIRPPIACGAEKSLKFQDFYLKFQRNLEISNIQVLFLKIQTFFEISNKKLENSNFFLHSTRLTA